MKASLVPTCLVIFGITGDLSRRKLIPALFDLFEKEALPQRFALVGVARRPFTDEEIRAHLRETSLGGDIRSEERRDRFLSQITYHQALFDEFEGYTALEKRLDLIDAAWGQCSNKLFYLATPPSQYETIFSNLAKSKLTVPCGGGEDGWTRILVEKPFGRDVASAARLDRLLGKLFDERQIFRIDHYLAKETLQNILTFRFANSMFEPLWSYTYIESVHIRLHEKIGIEGRGDFYEGLGALRDVGQNHMLQMLALVTMREPDLTDPDSIRKERARILSKLRIIRDADLPVSVVRAQYDSFRDEKGVLPDSPTETFFAMKAYLNDRTWKGVPFYLESGKALPETKTEIVITFKPTEPWRNAPQKCRNYLTFRIQPDEGITLSFWVKKPGFEMELEERQLSFSYGKNDGKKLPDAYERILFDCIRGDQTLFASTKEVKFSWKFITPILERLHTVPMGAYAAGTRPSHPLQ